jgi:hypothetical protein
MRRPGAALLAAIVVVCGGVGATASAGSAAPAWNPQMNTTCHIAGIVMFLPPLKNGPPVNTVAKIKWNWGTNANPCVGSANALRYGVTAAPGNELHVGPGPMNCAFVQAPGLPAMIGGKLTWNNPDGSNTNKLNAGMKLAFNHAPNGFGGRFTLSGGPAWLGGFSPFNGTEHVTAVNAGLCNAGGLPQLGIGGTVSFKS